MRVLKYIVIFLLFYGIVWYIFESKKTKNVLKDISKNVKNKTNDEQKTKQQKDKTKQQKDKAKQQKNKAKQQKKQKVTNVNEPIMNKKRVKKDMYG